LEGVELYGHALNAPLEEIESRAAQKSGTVDAGLCVDAAGFPFKTTAGRTAYDVYER